MIKIILDKLNGCNEKYNDAYEKSETSKMSNMVFRYFINKQNTRSSKIRI